MIPDPYPRHTLTIVRGKTLSHYRIPRLLHPHELADYVREWDRRHDRYRDSSFEVYTHNGHNVIILR